MLPKTVLLFLLVHNTFFIDIVFFSTLLSSMIIEVNKKQLF